MTRETFSNLILDSESTLYRVAMSMLRNEKDCEDAVQTAVLTAFEKLGTLKHEEYFKTWLVRILINVCNKQLKSAAKTTELHDTDIMSDSAEASTEIRMAIESLPVKIRQVVVLYYIEQFTVKQRSGAVERLLNRMIITPVAEMQQGIIISFYAIFFTFSARNPPLSNVL